MRDPMLLVNIQLALMGIVLVAGLFYLWRMICRVQKKVDDFILDMSSSAFMSKAGSMSLAPEAVTPSTDDDAAVDAFMNEVFGAPAMIINPSKSVSSVEISEEEPVVEPPATNVVDCGMSEASTVTGLSKTKLKRMSADALREVCKTHNLSTEGNKATLIDRVAEAVEIDE